MPDAPHFAWPFRLAGNHIQTVDQDTDEEIAACIAAIVSWPLGSRPDHPTFGVHELDFTQNGPDLNEIKGAVLENEPRAETLVSLDSPVGEALIADVRIAFDRRGSQ